MKKFSKVILPVSTAFLLSFSTTAFAMDVTPNTKLPDSKETLMAQNNPEVAIHLLGKAINNVTIARGTQNAPVDQIIEKAERVQNMADQVLITSRPSLHQMRILLSKKAALRHAEIKLARNSVQTQNSMDAASQ